MIFFPLAPKTDFSYSLDWSRWYFHKTRNCRCPKISKLIVVCICRLSKRAYIYIFSLSVFVQWTWWYAGIILCSGGMCEGRHCPTLQFLFSILIVRSLWLPRRFITQSINRNSMFHISINLRFVKNSFSIMFCFMIRWWWWSSMDFSTWWFSVMLRV